MIPFTWDPRQCRLICSDRKQLKGVASGWAGGVGGPGRRDDKGAQGNFGGDGHVNYLVGMVLPACTYVKI